MKTSHKTKKSTSPQKQHRAHSKAEAHKNFEGFEKMNKDIKNWGNSVSKRFLSNYAIPFARLVEAKLISLQSKV